MSSHYKTPEGEAAYVSAYDDALRSWPVHYEEIEVSSRFGTTYVIASGPTDTPPLVLLHGFMTTLLLWTPNIADLSEKYRVYAIDIMGNRNRSIPDQPILSAEDHVECLISTVDSLCLDGFNLVGMSHGGWLAINLALAVPERVRKLALISPAASLLPLARQFTMRAMASMLPPKRFWFLSLMGWMGLKGGPDNEFSQRLLDIIWLGFEHIETWPETMRVMPTVFSDDELSALQLPVLLLIGEDEVIYDAPKAIARARRLIPNLEAELVPRCGHDITFAQHIIVDARLLAFLKEDQADRI